MRTSSDRKSIGVLLGLTTAVCTYAFLVLLPVTGCSGARAAEEVSSKELFAMFHPDTETNIREPGAVVAGDQKQWEQALASLGNSSAPPVDFASYSVVLVTGQSIGGLCRNTAIKKVSRQGEGDIKITIEETYPEKCSGGAVCRCSLMAGMPPPIGKTVIATEVHKPVSKMEVETVSVIAKCCVGPHSREGEQN